MRVVRRDFWAFRMFLVVAGNPCCMISGERLRHRVQYASIVVVDSPCPKSVMVITRVVPAWLQFISGGVFIE